MANPIKVMALVISRSKTHVHIYPNLLLNCIMLETASEMKVLGFVLDTKYGFESHIRLIFAPASSKFGIMRKTVCLFGDPVLI